MFDEIRGEHDKGRPVLVGTSSVRESEQLAAALDASGISCEVLNAKTDDLEAKIIADAGAVGFHLSSTAADHFPQLLAIATPGPFFFLGDVPQELQQATEQMQLGAEFSTHSAGFDR